MGHFYYMRNTVCQVYWLLSFLKSKKEACVITTLCIDFQLLYQVTDFYKTLYEIYAIQGHPNTILFNFLHQ